jgi:hypothetical protein
MDDHEADYADPEMLSAQVVLRSASGAPFRPDAPITAANIGEHAPAPEDAAIAKQRFRLAGFAVGEVGGISFSISGPRTLFEEFFSTPLEVDERGAVSGAGSAAPAGGFELPLDPLPRELVGLVVAVVFSPPADLFGSEESILF